MLSITVALNYCGVMPSLPTPALLAEARALSAQLISVAERARADFAGVVSQVGLTPPQARAVLLLDQPTPMRSIATHLACDASNVTGLADRLEEMGVVERVPGEDRRVKLLMLTDRGAALRVEVVDRVARGSTVTARLTGKERRQLSTLLDKLLAEPAQAKA